MRPKSQCTPLHTKHHKATEPTHNDGAWREMGQKYPPTSPTVLWFPTAEHHQPNPTGKQESRRPTDTIQPNQPQRAQSERRKAEGGFRRTNWHYPMHLTHREQTKLISNSSFTQSGTNVKKIKRDWGCRCFIFCLNILPRTRSRPSCPWKSSVSPLGRVNLLPGLLAASQNLLTSSF